MQTDLAHPDKRISKLEHEVASLTEENALLREKLRLANTRYSPSSEKIEGLQGQGELFEVEELETPEPAESRDDDEETVVVRRKKSGRRPIPAHFAREVIEHPTEEGPCNTCGHEDFAALPPEITEELFYQPAVIKVLQHQYHKKACVHCRDNPPESDASPIIEAPRPPRLMPNSQVHPSLVAHVLTAKFADGLPFYRIEKQMARLGLQLNRNTMSRWAGQLMLWLKPMWRRLLEDAKAYGVMQMDETVVQVMNEPGRRNQNKSYMWVIRGGPPDKGLILFHYAPSRSGGIPIQLLDGYQGVLQTDGYSGYNQIGKTDGIVHAGDLDHARRKFADICKAEGKRKKTSYAMKTLKMFQEIYRMEKDQQKIDVSPSAILTMRREKSRPLYDALKQWLDDLVTKTPPSGALGKAVGYTLNEWPKLMMVFEDGRIPVSTILVENAIRPFVVGRKNWLFSGSPDGAEASAVLYSFIETAKANGWEPFQYLCWLFNELPRAKTPDACAALLPHRADPTIAAGA